jgi:hypothetical protein
MAEGLGTIRLDGSDKVYLVKGTKHWIKDLETLEKLGYKLGDEKWLKADEFAQYEEGEPVEIVETEPELPKPADLDFIGKEEPADKPDNNDIAEPVKELWQ